MFPTSTRRSWLQSTLRLGVAASAGELAFLAKLAPVSAGEAAVDPHTLRVDSGIAPVVNMIEATPRDRLLEEVAARIRSGLSYRELLAGLLLAGVKNIEPRPSVGHKFHAVLVVNSAHLASMASPPEHRWLPIFWALDYYKSAAARDVRERGDWVMEPVDDSVLPAPRVAGREFVAAMDAWDEWKADDAIAALARTAGANEIYEMLFRYGMRDFRSIGHKAIFVANSYRTLGCIGWRHAEPVLRSLVYALLTHEGDNPAERDAVADRPYRRNLEAAKKIRADWQAGAVDAAATTAMLETLRSGTNNEASDEAVAMVNRGVSPQSVWDALHLAAGELLMRQPGIVSLHAVTTTNALHFCYRAAATDETRRLLLLQNAAFVTMFRDAMEDRGAVKQTSLADLKQADFDAAAGGEIDEIFATLNNAPSAAADKLYTFLKTESSPERRANDVMKAARLLVFLKGDNAHDYKFSSAMLEDYHHVSPEHRPAYMAANIFMLRDSARPDNQLVARTRAALSA